MSGTLGDRVRNLRHRRRLSQTDLARGLVSPSYISLIEADRRMPEQPVLEALAQRLGTTVEYLEFGVDADQLREDELGLRYAELALRNGQAEEAVTRYRERTRSRYAGVRTRARWGLAKALEAVGRHEEAIGEAEALVEEARTGGPANASPGLLDLFTMLCHLYREVGDINHSIELGESGLREVRAAGLGGTEEEVQLAATVVGSYWERGDLVRAQVLATEVIRRAEQHDSRRARGSAYWNASVVAESRGELARALDLAERALAMFAEDDDARSIARLRTTYAWLLLRQDKPDVTQACQLLEAAHAAELNSSGSQLDLAYCETELARCRLYAGRSAEAIALARSALDRLPASQVVEAARARLVYGSALIQSGDDAAGLAAYQEATRGLATLGATRQAMTVWREVADTWERLGRHDEALAAYRRLADCAGALVPGGVDLATTSDTTAGTGGDTGHGGTAGAPGRSRPATGSTAAPDPSTADDAPVRCPAGSPAHADHH